MASAIIYWPNGKSIITAIDETRENLANSCVEAFNNKEDRTYTWRSGTRTTIINLEKVTAVEIQDDDQPKGVM